MEPPAVTTGTAAAAAKSRRRVGRPRRDIDSECIRYLKSLGLSFRVIAQATGAGYGTVRRAYLNAHPHQSTFRGNISDC